MDKTSFGYSTLTIGGYSVIGARACVGGPPRACTPPHMTSEVMLSAFIRVYPHVGHCVYPRLHRVCTASVTSCCDVMHLVCTASNSKTLVALVTTPTIEGTKVLASNVHRAMLGSNKMSTYQTDADGNQGKIRNRTTYRNKNKRQTQSLESDKLQNMVLLFKALMSD